MSTTKCFLGAMACLAIVFGFGGCTQNPASVDGHAGNLSGDFTATVSTAAATPVGQTGREEVGDSGEVEVYSGVQTIIRIKDNRSSSAQEEDSVDRINYWEDGALLSSNGKQILHSFDEGMHTLRVEITTRSSAYTVVFKVRASPAEEPVHPAEIDYIDSAWIEDGGDNIVVSIRYSIKYSPHTRGEADVSKLDPGHIGGLLGWNDQDVQRLSSPEPDSGYFGGEITLSEGVLSTFGLIVDISSGIWANSSLIEDESQMNWDGIFALRPLLLSGEIVVLNDGGDTLYRSSDTISVPEPETPGEVGDSLCRATVKDDSLHLYVYDEDSTESSIVIGGVRFRSEADDGWGEFSFELSPGEDELVFSFTGGDLCIFYDRERGACVIQVVQSGFGKRRIQQ